MAVVQYLVSHSQLLSLTGGTVVLSVCLAYLVWYKLFSFQGIPRAIQWVGPGSGLLQRGRTSLSSIFGLRDLLEQGYQTHSKYERPFILPNVLTGHEVILPMSQMRWLLEQPDTILSQHEVNKQFLAADQTMLHRKIIGEKHLGEFIRRELMRDLDSHSPAVVDEIKACLRDYLGDASSTDWHEVSLYDVMLLFIGRLVNRVLVGRPLCSNAEFLKYSTTFGNKVVLTAAFINLLPPIVRSLLGPFITAYDTFQYWRLARLVRPVLQERLSAFGSGACEKHSLLSASDFPNDYIQWALRDLCASGRSPSTYELEMAIKRLVVLGFAAVQSSAITITNVLYDIAAHPDSLTLQAQLRAEALSQLATITRAETSPGTAVWTRAVLARLVKIDSTLRESLRLWGFVSHGVTKAVVSPRGVMLPSGHHLPQGTKVGIASYGPQHDGDVYEDPMQFRPFRFCQDPKVEAGVVDSAKYDCDASITMMGAGLTQADAPARAFVTTSDYYMGFSHGRHACPGRFFAAQQLKLLLAHIAMDYDIEPLDVRPENPWLNNTIGPPIWSKVRVRRHADGV